MQKKEALSLSNLIEKSNTVLYEINRVQTTGGMLPKFHQWTNGKQTIAAYEVKRAGSDTGYFFLFIDWHRNDNYYLVIYAHDKSTTIAEIKQIKEIDGEEQFVWMYKPFKRDGKNDQRKAYFKQMFGSTTVQIKIPLTFAEVDSFLEHLFKLCQNRIKADRIVEVFDFDNM